MSGGTDLRALTSARGIAAWIVVLFHVRLGIMHMPPGWARTLSFGYLAVDFFFLLSGFVIWLSWSDRLRSEGWRGVPVFLKKRVARIWPLHLLMLAGAVAFAVTLWFAGKANPVAYPFGELPLHVFLLQNWGFTDQLSWNVPAWSISCEFAAYLMFPLLVRTVDWDALPSWLVVGAIGALIVILVAIISGSPSLTFDIPRYGLIRCLMEFTIGSAVCGLWTRWRHAPKRPAIVAGAVTSLGLAGWYAGFSESLIAPATFAALLLTLALTSGMRGNPLAWAPLHYLGEISYATYLSHFMLFVLFKLLFVDDARAVSPALIASYLAIVLVCSAALYHLVERPAQRWVNRLRLPVLGTKDRPAHS